MKPANCRLVWSQQAVVLLVAIALLLSLQSVVTAELTEDQAAFLERKVNSLPSQREGEVTLRLIPSHTSLEPGQTFQVGVDFRIRFGWHMYAAEKTGSQIPVRLKWTLPDGVEVRDVSWSKAETDAESKAAAYTRKARAIATLSTTKAVAGEMSELKVKVSWQVCKDVCKVGAKELSLPMAWGASQATELAPLLESQTTGDK